MGTHRFTLDRLSFVRTGHEMAWVDSRLACVCEWCGGSGSWLSQTRAYMLRKNKCKLSCTTFLLSHRSVSTITRSIFASHVIFVSWRAASSLKRRNAFRANIIVCIVQADIHIKASK